MVKTAQKYGHGLDESSKKWYDSIMENVTLINAQIAQNLTLYRKAANLTQAELAEKINYSDKSVSKWESGNGVPDIYILLKLAEIFGVTLDELVGGNARQIVAEREEQKKKSAGIRILIMLLSSGIVWLIATCLFVATTFWFGDSVHEWMAFIYAIPVNAILLIVFAVIWKYKMLNFISVSTLIWSSMLGAFLTTLFVSQRTGNMGEGAWASFILGVPLQVLEVLWAYFRYTLVKKRKKENEVDE